MIAQSGSSSPFASGLHAMCVLVGLLQHLPSASAGDNGKAFLATGSRPKLQGVQEAVHVDQPPTSKRPTQSTTGAGVVVVVVVVHCTVLQDSVSVAAGQWVPPCADAVVAVYVRVFTPS